ncbi:hypothetical protein MnTg02_01084 [bacterium MnTg02]|nr:hypothetical protein MnTg02_01084 [bacterium MnTg02]
MWRIDVLIGNCVGTFKRMKIEPDPLVGKGTLEEAKKEVVG